MRLYRKEFKVALRKRYYVDDGHGVELSCEGKEGKRIAVIPMLVFELFIVDTGGQPPDNVRNHSNFQKVIGEDVAWI